MRLTKYLILVMLCSFVLPAFASSIERIGLEQGLSQSSIYAIHQDKIGFMWFASADGLNRYDGKNIQVFRFNEKQIQQGASNFFGDKLIEDEDHNLYFGTATGIGQYHFTSNKLKILPVSFNSAYKLSTVVGIYNRKLWFVNGFNICSFHLDSNTTQFFPLPDILKTYNYLRGIVWDKKGAIWMNTHLGVTQFNTQSLKYSNFRLPSMYHASKLGYIKLLQMLPSGLLLFQSQNGILTYNYKNNECTLLNTEIKGFIVASAIYENQLVATVLNGGLFFIDLKSGKINRIISKGEYSNSLNNLIFTSLFIDTHNNLWVGLDGFGINRIGLQPQRFKLYNKQNTPSWNTLSSFTKSFFEYGDTLFFATHENGLRYLIRSSNKIGDIVLPKYMGSTITGVYLYQKNKLLIGGLNQLILYDIKTGAIVPFKIQISETLLRSELQIFQIHPFADGCILFTSFFGNYYYNGNAELKFEKIKSFNSYTGAIYQDKQGVVWVSTIREGEISRYYKQGTQLVYLDHLLPNFNVRWFYEDTLQQRLYMASSKGLICYHTQKKTYEIINRENGLPDNFIYAILPGNNGELWLSSNTGLFSYHPQTKQVKWYKVEDGLQSNEFNSNSAIKLRSGELVFGGVNGFNVFHPEKIWHNPYAPKAALTNLRILDEALSDSINPASIKFITLPHHQNTLSLEFATFEYCDPHQIASQFKLEGVDPNWVNEPQKRLVRYANLAPGNYTFLLKTANRDGVWSNEIELLKVHILPPWWLLWWVLVLEVLLLLAVIFLIIRFIIQRKLKEKESELARLKLIHAERERIGRDMHDDLGSGLTQITIISELLKQNMPEEIKAKQLQKISETAGELVDNMGNLVWAMNPGYDSIPSLLAYLREFCGKLFDNSSIQLEVDFPFQMEEFALSPHIRKNIFLAVKESLNNSLKYSQASNLKISYYMLHSKHILVIEDNGIGFNLAQVRKFGNGIHNIQKRLKDIAGEAQIWSEEGKGTRIQLEF